MKALQNPTNFFFQQSSNPPTEYRDKINEFVKQLLNLKQCVLCKEEYNFTNRIPRILVHCGHTFCTECLKNFYRNFRVRCPLCLKLIKNLETIERLPVNHTIFTRMAEELNEKNRQRGEEEIDMHAALYAQFEQAQAPRNKQAPVGAPANAVPDMYQAPSDMGLYPGPVVNGAGGEYDATAGIVPDGGNLVKRIDEETGLEICEYHTDRIKHFFCMTHKDACCRVCSELLHQKQECMIVDLYEIEDMHGFLNEFCNGAPGAGGVVPNVGGNLQEIDFVAQGNAPIGIVGAENSGNNNNNNKKMDFNKTAQLFPPGGVRPGGVQGHAPQFYEDLRLGGAGPGGDDEDYEDQQNDSYENVVNDDDDDDDEEEEQQVQVVKKNAKGNKRQPYERQSD